jgi:hypothetical protein
MSPKRLLRLEELLYPQRAFLKKGDLPTTVELAPATAADDPPRKKKRCYPGIPETGEPKRNVSVFEKPLPKEMRDLFV